MVKNEHKLSMDATYRRYVAAHAHLDYFTRVALKLGFLICLLVGFAALAGRHELLSRESVFPLLLLALAGVSGGGFILAEMAGKQAQGVLIKRVWLDH